MSHDISFSCWSCCRMLYRHALIAGALGRDKTCNMTEWVQMDLGVWLIFVCPFLCCFPWFASAEKSAVAEQVAVPGVPWIPGWIPMLIPGETIRRWPTQVHNPLDASLEVRWRRGHVHLGYRMLVSHISNSKCQAWMLGWVRRIHQPRRNSRVLTERPQTIEFWGQVQELREIDSLCHWLEILLWAQWDPFQQEPHFHRDVHSLVHSLVHLKAETLRRATAVLCSLEQLDWVTLVWQGISFNNLNLILLHLQWDQWAVHLSFSGNLPQEMQHHHQVNCHRILSNRVIWSWRLSLQLWVVTVEECPRGMDQLRRWDHGWDNYRTGNLTTMFHDSDGESSCFKVLRKGVPPEKWQKRWTCQLFCQNMAMALFCQKSSTSTDHT